MALKQDSYDNIRKLMEPGDVIAFSGKASLHDVVKWATRSPVTHVAVILQSKLVIGGEIQAGYFNQIIESTTNGVITRQLSRIAKKSDMDLWWLSLSKESREKIDLKKFYDFLFRHSDKEYDYVQAGKGAMDKFDNHPLLSKLTYNEEDFSKFFCSELVTGALEAGGVIKDINASEVMPIDLCRFNIFSEDYVQFKGDPTPLSRYNTVDPACV